MANTDAVVCATCRYLDRMTNECHKLAPAPIYRQEATVAPVEWPVVDPLSDWCGEYKAGQ